MVISTCYSISIRVFHQTVALRRYVGSLSAYVVKLLHEAIIDWAVSNADARREINGHFHFLFGAGVLRMRLHVVMTTVYL